MARLPYDIAYICDTLVYWRLTHCARASVRHETLRCLGYQRIPPLIRIFSGVSEPVRGAPRSIAYYLRFRQWKNRQREIKIINIVETMWGRIRVEIRKGRDTMPREYSHKLDFVFSASSVI